MSEGRTKTISGKSFGRADPDSLRFEMSQTDPDFARVRKVQHDARGLIGASRNAQQLAQRVLDGRSIRHEQEFWQEHG